MSNNQFTVDVTRTVSKTVTFVLESASDVDEAESKALEMAANYDFGQVSGNNVDYLAEMTSAPSGSKIATREEHYLNHNGTVCPSCFSGDIEGGDVEVDGGEVYQTVTCRSCDKSWEDQFVMKGIAEPEGFDPKERIEPPVTKD